jgi:hypothetical protein
MKTLLVALHDVTPAHAKRLERAERLFEAIGLPRVTYLLVPRFHGGPPAHRSRDFVGWCHESRPFEVQWFLHGYFHDENTVPAPPTGRASLAEWWGSNVVTAREAEFLRLRGTALRLRLSGGMLSFEECLGRGPEGFVAPGWLFNGELLGALAEFRVQFTETPFRIIQVGARRELKCPVITWATRDLARRAASRAVAAARLRGLREDPIVRVAVHPSDFDHAATVTSIARTIDALRRDRDVVHYSDELFGVTSGRC